MHRFLSSLFIFWFLIFNVSNLFAQVKEYFITCDPDDFAYIYENWEEDIDIPVTLTYNGVTWTDAEMRIRGDGTRMYPKKSLKVQFNDEPFVDGKETLNFNAEYEDKSYIRAFVASQVFNMTGQHCFVTEHARLYLNGEFLGLYNRTENMDEQFLEENGYDPTGNLYKATYDGACMSIYDSLTFWEQKTGTGNKEDLAQFIAEINEVSVEDFHSFCAEKLNYDQVINMIACNMALSNQSTYYHNYYMFHHINGTGKWEMLPWDLDKTLSVYSWRNHTYSSAPWAPDNPYLEKAILNPTTMADIKTRANQIFQQILNTSVFWPKIDSLVAVLQTSVAQDTTDNIENVDEWLAQVAIEKNYISTSAGRLNWYFDHVQSSFTCEPTPYPVSSPVTFNWMPSVDPDGLPVTYRLKVTTGYEFEPELTQVFDNIQTTSFTVDLPEGEYKWRLISVDASEQEVEAFNSRNPLTVIDFETMPCTISENTVLTAENSPYLVNCNTIVEEQAKLTINEGVQLFFNNNTHLNIKGGFEVAGTKENPVIIKPFDPNGSFDSLVFVNPSQNIRINHIELTDGAIYAYNANVKVDNSKFRLVNKDLPGQNVFYRHYYGRITFENSSLYGNNTGQGLEFGYCDTVIIANSYFSNISDPMELISIIDNGWVTNNIAINSNDDCIDFNNCKNLTISGNILYNAGDNGISIGADANGFCENIYMAKNLVVGCTTGILVKDGSDALLDRNTLFNNLSGIRVIEEHLGWGGSNAQVVNTIISNAQNQAWFADGLSEISINYCLCDTETLPGLGNLHEDPRFVEIADSIFTLQTSSPCIDAGDPSSPPDMDGTRADIGAFYFNQGIYNVIFNEINYKSASNFDTEDWIELYNVDAQPADISSWIFKDEDDEHIFEFPYGTIIEPGQFLVLCSDAGLFTLQNPDVTNYIGSFPFGLSSGGELIRLFNKTGVLMDSVVYDNQSPWPEEPNGQGPTLELKSPFFDNTLPENWCASSNYGTPGRVNSCVVYDVEKICDSPIVFNVYPNPASESAYLQIRNVTKGQLTVELFTADGKQHLISEKYLESPGTGIIELKSLPVKGICLVRITFVNGQECFTKSIKLLVQPTH